MTQQPLKAIAIGIIASALFAGSALADSSGSGLGGYSCAQFVKDYRRDSAMAGLAYLSWAQGYMTGYNSSQNGMQRQMRNLDAIGINEQVAALGEMCEANAELSFQQAVHFLYLSFPYLIETSN